MNPEEQSIAGDREGEGRRAQRQSREVGKIRNVDQRDCRDGGTHLSAQCAGTFPGALCRLLR